MTRRIVAYGDFNCPWSFLAERRVSVLARDGTEVDWRAVEHEPRRPSRPGDQSDRFAHLREEMDRVASHLLPDEAFPYTLAGFVPYTKSAVSGYAEAYGAGVGSRVRDLLFTAFWLHGVDLGDARTVRTLLVDAIRSGSSTSEVLREWGYAVDVTGAPLTVTGWRLVRGWREEWEATGKEIVPIVVADDGPPVFGVDAVEWLGEEIQNRGLDPTPTPEPPAPAPAPRRDLASLLWVSENGNRWLRDYRLAHSSPLLPNGG